MSRRTRNNPPVSRRLSAVSSAHPAEESAPKNPPIKNGENRINSPAAPYKDSRGRFTVGNPGGPGRPRKLTQSEYQAATLALVAVDGWEQVVTKALEDAQSGDKHARRWLSDYVLGHPSAPSVVDGIALSTLTRLIGLLRTTGHQPETFFDDLIQRLTEDKKDIANP